MYTKNPVRLRVWGLGLYSPKQDQVEVHGAKRKSAGTKGVLQARLRSWILCFSSVSRWVKHVMVTFDPDSRDDSEGLLIMSKRGNNVFKTSSISELKDCERAHS